LDVTYFKGECVTDPECVFYFLSGWRVLAVKKTGMPIKQGLYDPRFEHDSCGIGAVVNISGKREHRIISQALTILSNLGHRGGAGSEEDTGDGAGILLQIPDRFFRQVCPNAGIELPSEGDYGVGMLFLPNHRIHRKKCERAIEHIVSEEGLNGIGWRTLPVNEACLGSKARLNRPYIRQLFIAKSDSSLHEIEFERKLYIIRKRCERLVYGLSETDNSYFYFASLSARTIVYKGMLTAEQLDKFYIDLSSTDVESSLALVHSRFSTNTFPSWERAHPYRYLIHNGEINTLRGNVNWMKARQTSLRTDDFGPELNRIFPIVNENGSDSSMFDNCLEFLVLSGRTLPHAMMMMVPEPWNHHESMSDERKAFYEFHNILMEPWDGPAAMVLTDGRMVVASLDRNGLRPSRYCITSEGQVILASEAGVLDIPAEKIVSKDRLRPGRMLVIDTIQGRVMADDEIKESIASVHDYRRWLTDHMIHLEKLPSYDWCVKKMKGDIEKIQKVFGFTYEDLCDTILPMAALGEEPIGSMGNDVPIAVLSQKPQLLFNYFKQLFAQVTNPPIDAIREQIVTSTETYMGTGGNLLDPEPLDCRQVKLKYPVITNEQLEKIRNIKEKSFRSVTLPICFDPMGGEKSLEFALTQLFEDSDRAIRAGKNILILSDRNIHERLAPIPSLLAVSGLHQHLVRRENRTRVSIVLESGEPREVHHMALLIGYGVSCVNPYLVFESIDRLIGQSHITGISKIAAYENYIQAIVKGIVKIISKMGISTILSYQGSQIFEAIGISQDVIDRYFTSTPSRLGGIGLDTIAREVIKRHRIGMYSDPANPGLESGGVSRWKSDGEYHQFNPLSIYQLQQAVRNDDYEMFQSYSSLMNEENRKGMTIRGLLQFKASLAPIPLEQVEPVEEIVKRFKTGAMSYGSISKEAHETLAIAMNRIGGKSNTGEGGEDPTRFQVMANGDSKCSAIKQVASGRFGVTSDYLVHAKEIQIKIAQGAKPGEGGQLPGNKVYPWIAKTRHSTPGVGLISPPPHHDIYSIEDLAQLIYDLKNANSSARISVKLVSEVGVGTVAAGVAKGRADVVLISGYDGGTGASPVTSIRHAGLPWELGLAETHQTLVLNNLRSRIVVETDGKLLTGRDVIIAAILGAEEFGFATAPLVALGCVMMRACNLDTCPVGVATQNPKLREKFEGKPEYVERFMRFIASEMREIMADIGVKSLDNLIGHTELLEAKPVTDHLKRSNLDLSCLLYRPVPDSDIKSVCVSQQDHELQKTMDQRILIPICEYAIKDKKPITASFPIRNIDRAVATQLGSEITKRHGSEGLPEDTVSLRFRGCAGQSFGGFIPQGVTLYLEGDANDYLGKGLSGGKIIVTPDREAAFDPAENIIIGNVALYGATGGEAYIYGITGERFAVRNSGAHAVVESVGDHACEYMTGGVVVVLGSTGRNFAAGMSGGVAYVLDETGTFPLVCNRKMVILDKITNSEEKDLLRKMIQKYYQYTGSRKAKKILNRFTRYINVFVKVMPCDYAKMLEAIAAVRAKGVENSDEVMLAAFEMNKKQIADSDEKTR
jgi:glutamate synthase (NADPH) large chain